VHPGLGPYYRFQADGTIWSAGTREDLRDNPWAEGAFWFDDGTYYEEGQICEPIGIYRVFLQVQETRAIGLRFEEIDDSDRSCHERRYSRQTVFARVD
jgi:hypothetical protein